MATLFEDKDSYIPEQESPLNSFKLNSAATADHLGLLPTLGYGAVAAVVDAGTTMWNSLIPASMETSTEDVLSRIDQNALAVYKEHPDTVQTASFIGGMFAPIGISMKGMQYLRSGSKGASWFNEAGRVSRMKEVESAMRASGAATQESIKAQRAYYAANAANAVTDMFAAEVAINATMNAHPWMEDYQKDFAKNFAMNLALGSFIGAGAGHIIARGEVRATRMGVEKEFSSLLKVVKEEPELTANVGQRLQQRMQNVDNMNAHIAASVDPKNPLILSNYITENLKLMVQKESATITEEFSAIAGKSIMELPNEVRTVIRNLVAKDSRFATIDKVGHVNIKNLTPFEGTLEKPVGTLRSAWNFTVKTLTAEGEEVSKRMDAVFSPVFNRFIGKKEAANIVTLADTGTNLKQLQKNAVSKTGQEVSYVVRDDAALLNSVNTTAIVEKDFAQVLLRVSQRTLPEMLEKIPTAASNDLAVLKALLVKVDALKAAGDDVSSLSIRVIPSNPSKEFLKKLEEMGKTPREIEEAVITKVSASNLSDYVEGALRKEVKELQKSGFGVETIALRTGTPVDTINHIISQNPSPLLSKDLIKFRTEEDITRALDPILRALNMSTNMNKNFSSSIYSNLNKSTYDTMAQGIIEAQILSSSSTLVRETIGKNILSEESKASLHFIGKKAEDLLGTGIRNTFLTSVNFAVDNLGEVGNLMTAFGKHVTNAKNVAKEIFTNPLAATLATLAKDTVSTIEFNTAINVQAAVRGIKVFKAGQFWKPAEGSRITAREVVNLSDSEFLAYIKSIDPKTGTVIESMQAVQFNNAEYKVVNEGVKKALEQIQAAGRELYELKNVSHISVGKGDLPDIGFWSPAANPMDKEIAYVFNKNTQETTMLMAKTVEELNSGIRQFREGLGKDAAFHDIVTKGDEQRYYNILKDRHDPMYMGIADVSKQHGGASARALASTNTEVMADIVQGYDNYIGKGIDDLVRIQLDPIMARLDDISVISQKGYTTGTKGTVSAMRKKPSDPGQVMKNILLGRNNLSEHQWWASAQNGMQVMTDTVLTSITDIVSPMIGKGTRTPEEWKKVAAEMEAKGIVNPFQTLDNAQDIFIAEGKLAREALSPRTIALSNALAATVVLRAGELGHALVNILSLPILTSAAVSRKLSSSFAGGTLDPLAKFTMPGIMYDGVRLENHPTMGKHWEDIAVNSGVFKEDWRTVNNILQQVKSLEPGLATKMEEALESNLVKFLSKGADMSETFVRRRTFFTGIALAKKAYPNIPDSGALLFARNFMDEAVGNYAAAQRPAFFQGTFGMAMGLFQTYMLTYGQHLYRQLEGRDWKAMGKMLLTQDTIFGTASLPGFHPISEAIGNHFSDNNIDLETGTFRALPNELAQTLLYGLPSQLVGITTRGDIQPRIPNPFSLDTLAVVNLTKQTYNTMERVIGAVAQADENSGKAMLEALSLQSISRPVARIAELAAGHSITSSGKIVAQKEELWTTSSILSRGFATRPIEEIQARQAMHLDSLYGSLDHDNRQEVTFKLKSYIENGNLTQEKLSKLAETYMRTGSPTGWRTATREAIAQSGRPGNATVREHLNPRSPTMLLIDDLD